MLKHLKKSRTSAYYLVGCQTVLTLLVSLGFYLSGHFDTAYGALLGGAVAIIPNVVFASLVFQFSGATRAQKIANQFYKAEALKWVLTFGLFAVIITCLKPAPVPFFIMYIITTMVIWLSPLFFKSSS
jgi:ATP synthase protein I